MNREELLAELLEAGDSVEGAEGVEDSGSGEGGVGMFAGRLRRRGKRTRM